MERFPSPTWTGGPLRRYLPNSIQRLGPCCCLKLGRAVALPLPRCRLVTSSGFRTTRFDVSCSVACACRCRWSLGHACPTAGVLVRRAGPLERAVARVCREAGARVATNVYLNLGVPLSDGRRLEVVANGLPGFGGVQVAVDATLVSPVRRDGTNRPAEPGLALREATDHKRRSTRARRGAALLSSPSRLGGAGGTRRKPSCTASQGARPSPAPKTSAERLPPHTRAGGGSCWLSRRRARSRPASARFLPTLATPLLGRRRRATSSATPAGRRTREGPCVSPRLDGKRRVRKKEKDVDIRVYPEPGWWHEEAASFIRLLAPGGFPRACLFAVAPCSGVSATCATRAGSRCSSSTSARPADSSVSPRMCTTVCPLVACCLGHLLGGLDEPPRSPQE